MDTDVRLEQLAIDLIMASPCGHESSKHCPLLNTFIHTYIHTIITTTEIITIIRVFIKYIFLYIIIIIKKIYPIEVYKKP